MDLRFSEEDEAFRKEVREFLSAELPPDWEDTGDTESSEAKAFRDQFVKKLVAKGWRTGAWPKEYGGQGWSFTKQLVFNEEMAARKAPKGDFLGPHVAAPPIMVHGTEEQKKMHLPPIAKAEAIWCEGFSEPNAGSDLASLQTRAVEEGDYFILNGQKTWTTHAHYADWGIFLARTDPTAPKHKGISCFLIDMKTPGVTVVPIVDASGFHSLNEVYLDNAKIPRSGLLGEKNKAWSQTIRTTLDFERSGAATVTALGIFLERLIKYTKGTKRNGAPLANDPIIRQKLANMVVEVAVARVLAYRIAWMQNEDLPITGEASQTKLFSSELQQRLANVGMQILKMPGLIKEGSRWAPQGGAFEKFYVTSIPITFGAGTSEVQRQVVALSGLGLPREPRPAKGS